MDVKVSKHILVVEDDDTTRRFLMTLLEMCGYEVEGVQDGLQALDTLPQGNFNGMVLDLFMPIINGLEVLKHLKESHSSLPVIITTAHPEYAEQALAQGAKECLIKPFEADELKRAVECWVGPP